MVILITIETLLLILLTLLMAGVLRTQAEILRRLGAPHEPLARPAELVEAKAIVGEDLAGTPTRLSPQELGTNVLVAFLSSGCTICADFWSAFETEPLTIPGDSQRDCPHFS